MHFCNKTFFRNGSFYFAPAPTKHTLTFKSVFICSFFSLAFQTLKDTIYSLGIFNLTTGAALRLLVAYKPDIAPISLGVGFQQIKDKDLIVLLYQPYNAWMWTYVNKVFELLGLLMSKFSEWYFKPFALSLARHFRLSSYLFGENKVNERGHIVYRNWKQMFFASHAAQMSNPNLYTQPQLRNEIPGLFESCPTVDAYFVPDGRYARVPNYAEINPTKRYFVTVSRNDQVLDSKPIDVTLANAELIDIPAYSYDVVYIPPCFKARMFCFYFLMGVVANITSLYLLLSSNFIGSKTFHLAAKIPRLEPLIDTDTYFTCANICLGAALQLFLFNTFKDNKIAIQGVITIISKAKKYFFASIVLMYTRTAVTFPDGDWGRRINETNR
ncbi:hypothetical protein ACO0QE_002310 [Hanseniaspora vineae]